MLVELLCSCVETTAKRFTLQFRASIFNLISIPVFILYVQAFSGGSITGVMWSRREIATYIDRCFIFWLQSSKFSIFFVFELLFIYNAESPFYQTTTTQFTWLFNKYLSTNEEYW